jgi:hypothetical protein
MDTFSIKTKFHILMKNILNFKSFFTIKESLNNIVVDKDIIDAKRYCVVAKIDDRDITILDDADRERAEYFSELYAQSLKNKLKVNFEIREKPKNIFTYETPNQNT